MSRCRQLKPLQLRACSHDAVSSAFNVARVNDDYAGKVDSAVRASKLLRGSPAFRMVLPPPNVTGRLHLGHALTVTVEDAVVRHHRLRGVRADWIPGFDHAGIATQSVVERALWSERRLRRCDLGVVEFRRLCERWAEQNSAAIAEQLKRLGASLDWSQQYYTLDQNFTAAVNAAFCRLHDESLLYRGTRLVHWCPSLQTTLSDQEVDRVDASSRALIIPAPGGGTRKVHLGLMYRVRYKLEDAEEFLEVGTTRPETCLADVALAVHPDDSRYSKFIGRRVRHPVQDRFMPVIADSAVIADKGSGVVKITPAHDHLDASIAARHWPALSAADPTAAHRNCLDVAGRIALHSHPEFDGLDRFEARAKMVRVLQGIDRGGDVMKHENAQVMLCSRSGDVIEPRLMSQWFLDTKTLHAQCSAALQNGQINVVPSGQLQRLLDWFANDEPWCLSRQLVWGHRIPAFRASAADEFTVSNDAESAAAQLKCSIDQLQQDTDVLDTWFSSALVPLVISGWPHQTAQQLSMPSLSLMETGHDIVGFWVARMIALTIHFANGAVPFKKVLLHGLVRDSEGRKMSKSLGNVIDPLDVVDGISLADMQKRLDQSNLSDKEIKFAQAAMAKQFPKGIPRAGADALRFALLRHDVTAADIPIAVSQLVDEGLKFCNKLWNMTNYALILNSACTKKASTVEITTQRQTDKWILSRLAATLDAVGQLMASPDPSTAFRKLFDFLLADVCDVYLETTKSALWSKDADRLQEINAVLEKVLSASLLQLSAFMPFAAEAMIARFDGFADRKQIEYDASWRDVDLEKAMAASLAIVTSMRSVRAQLEIPKSMKFDGFLQASGESTGSVQFIPDAVRALSGLELLPPLTNPQKDDFVPCPVQGVHGVLWIRIEESHRADFRSRLQRQLEKFTKKVSKLESTVESFKFAYDRDVKNDAKSEKISRSLRRYELESGKLKAAREELRKLKAVVNS